MSNNGIPPLNDWQADNYPTVYDEGNETLYYVKSGVKNEINTGGSGYLVYTALLSQSGTDAPVATVLQNTLSGAIVWTRTNSGRYVGTLAGAFPVTKTACFITSATLNSTATAANNEDGEPSDEVFVSTSADGETFADDLLYLSTIEIRVYP